jgi:hypothetical protein
MLTEECLEILEKKEYYEKCKAAFGGRNSFSKTDKDATFMHMKDDHMESAFGVMKEDMGFRRFLTRGRMNISTEFMLLCFGFNVNKLHSKTVNNKRGFKIYKEELLKQAV